MVASIDSGRRTAQRGWGVVSLLSVLLLTLGPQTFAQQQVNRQQKPDATGIDSKNSDSKKLDAKAPNSKIVDSKIIENLTHEANLAVQSGHDDRADDLFRSVLRIDPRNHTALMSLGYIARRSNNRGEALEYFARACATSRTDPQCHLELGYALQQSRSIVDAELEFHKAACIAGAHQAQAKAATLSARQDIARDAAGNSKAPLSFETEVDCPNDGALPGSPTSAGFAPSAALQQPAMTTTALPSQKPGPAPAAAVASASNSSPRPIPNTSSAIAAPTITAPLTTAPLIAAPAASVPALPGPMSAAPGGAPAATTPAAPAAGSPLLAPPPVRMAAAAPAPAPSPMKYQRALPTGNYELRALGYQALNDGNKLYALHVFEVTVAQYPSDALAIRQLAYLEIDQKRVPQAIGAFEALYKLGAEDAQTSLQLAYLYDQQKDYGNAAKAFRRAIAFKDAKSDAQARNALNMLLQSHPKTLLELYTFPLYTTRFSDGIVDAQVKLVHRLTYSSPISITVGARLLRDSASGAGHLPQLYSDNAAMFGAGIRFQPVGAHYSIEAQANEAYLLPLSNSLRPSALVPDYRFSAGYFRRWQLPHRIGVEANGSVGYYSRYNKDAIAYVIPRETYRLYSAESFSISAYAREMAVADSARYFYNNIAEGAPGIDFAFGHEPMLSIRGEYVEGMYLNTNNSSSQNPYSNPYHDLRVQIVFGKIIPLHLGRR